MVEKSLIQLKLLAKAILSHALLFINHSPKLRNYVMVVINRFGLDNTVRTFYVFLVNSSNQSNARKTLSFTPKDIRQLSPQARNVYANLDSAIKSHKSEKIN